MHLSLRVVLVGASCILYGLYLHRRTIVHRLLLMLLLLLLLLQMHRLLNDDIGLRLWAGYPPLWLALLTAITRISILVVEYRSGHLCNDTARAPPRTAAIIAAITGDAQNGTKLTADYEANEEAKYS